MGEGTKHTILRIFRFWLKNGGGLSRVGGTQYESDCTHTSKFEITFQNKYKNIVVKIFNYHTSCILLLLSHTSRASSYQQRYTSNREVFDLCSFPLFDSRTCKVSVGFTRYTSNVEVFTVIPQTWRFLPLYLKRGGFRPVKYPALQSQNTHSLSRLWSFSTISSTRR